MSQPRHRDLNPDADPFRPPEIPTEVHCLHCGREYESYLIEWREQLDANGQPRAFWCCDDEYDELDDDDSNNGEFDNDEPYREYENPGDDSDIPF